MVGAGMMLGANAQRGLSLIIGGRVLAGTARCGRNLGDVRVSDQGSCRELQRAPAGGSGQDDQVIRGITMIAPPTEKLNDPSL